MRLTPTTTHWYRPAAPWRLSAIIRLIGFGYNSFLVFVVVVIFCFENAPFCSSLDSSCCSNVLLFISKSSCLVLSSYIRQAVLLIILSDGSSHSPLFSSVSMFQILSISESV